MNAYATSTFSAPIPPARNGRGFSPFFHDRNCAGTCFTPLAGARAFVFTREGN